MRHPYLGVSKNNGTPQISHFNRAFHYKPSILGETPLFKETTHLVKVKKFGSKNPWLSSWNRSGRPMNGDPPKQWCASGAWGIFSGAGNFRTWWFKVTFLGWLSDPCKGLSDLQLEDEKVTLNHLAEVFFCFFCGKGSWTWPLFFFFSSKLYNYVLICFFGNCCPQFSSTCRLRLATANRSAIYSVSWLRQLFVWTRLRIFTPFSWLCLCTVFVNNPWSLKFRSCKNTLRTMASQKM